MQLEIKTESIGLRFCFLDILKRHLSVETPAQHAIKIKTVEEYVMPHIHLEYSDNIDTLDVKPMLLALNQALLDGQFVQSGNDIKSRAIRQSDFVIGVDGDAQAYLHAKVSLLSGRDEATKCAISSKLLKTLQQNFTAPQDLTVQICVEIIEMPKSSYSKLVLKA